MLTLELMVKDLIFFIRLGTSQECPLSLLLFNTALGAVNQAIRPEKEIKGIKIRMEKQSLSLFVDNTFSI